MKKYIKSIAAVFLALIVGLELAVAAGGIKDTNEVIGGVRKFTPTIDGAIDDEYRSSYHAMHVWDAEFAGFGKYSDDKDENPQGVVYGWDCKASSYLLWDEQNIYIAIEITDDDYGCVDAEHYEIIESYGAGITGPYKQDGVIINLKYDGELLQVYASRDGKVFFRPVDPRLEDGSAWCDVLIWYEYRGGEDGSYHAVTEVEGGYVIEACIRVDGSVKEMLMQDGGVFSYGLSAVDSTSDSPYYLLADMIMTEDMSEGWWLADTVIMGEGFAPETSEINLRKLILSEEEAFVLPPYDLTADGEFDANDLTCLMRVIAGDSTAVIAQSADINTDGYVDVKDLTRMMRYLAAR